MTVATRKLLQNSCDGPTMRFVSTKNDEQLNIQGYVGCYLKRGILLGADCR